MSWRRTNIFRKRFTNEMSLQNIKEKKVGCHTKYYQKTSKFCLVSTFFNFKQIVTLFCFLLLFVLYFFFFQKTHYGAKRRKKRRNEQQWSDVEKIKPKHKEQRRKKQHYGEKLKHAVHNLRINAHKYKSSKRQILQIKDK